MTTPYVDEADAQLYFDERLRTDAWDDASSADRVKALKQATRAIDRLNFAGEKADPDQELQFPRGDDTVVPQDVMDACCELALALLDDVDPNLEVENLNNLRQGIGDARVERDTGYAQEHVRAGIPSIQAWTLLRPYLIDPKSMEVSRG